MPRYVRCVAVPQRRSVAENCEPVTARTLAIGAIAAQPSKRPNQRPKPRSPLDVAFFLVHPNVGPELASAVRIGSGRPTGGFVRPNWIVSSVPWRLLVLGLYRSMSRDSRASVRAADNVRRIPGKSRWCC